MTTRLPDPYGDIADELHRIADDLRKLGPGHPAPPWCQLSIQPHKADADDETIAHVDHVAVALLGKPASTVGMPSSHHHHTITGRRGPVSVSVYQSVGGPEQRELERLRAEIAALRKTGYGREVDNGDPAAQVPAGVYGEGEGAGPGRHSETPKDVS